MKRPLEHCPRFTESELRDKHSRRPIVDCGSCAFSGKRNTCRLIAALVNIHRVSVLADRVTS